MKSVPAKASLHYKTSNPENWLERSCPCPSRRRFKCATALKSSTIFLIKNGSSGVSHLPTPCCCCSIISLRPSLIEYSTTEIPEGAISARRLPRSNVVRVDHFCLELFSDQPRREEVMLLGKLGTDRNNPVCATCSNS